MTLPNTGQTLLSLLEPLATQKFLQKETIDYIEAQLNERSKLPGLFFPLIFVFISSTF